MFDRCSREGFARKGRVYADVYLLLGLVLLRLVLPGPLLLRGGLRIGRVGGMAVRLESM